MDGGYHRLKRDRPRGLLAFELVAHAFLPEFFMVLEQATVTCVLRVVSQLSPARDVPLHNGCELHGGHVPAKCATEPVGEHAIGSTTDTPIINCTVQVHRTCSGRLTLGAGDVIGKLCCDVLGQLWAIG